MIFQTVCISSSTFVAHLVNQGVAQDVLVLEMLMLLIERPTDTSVEIAVGLMKHVGAYLAENTSQGSTVIFERFRAVLNESNISPRVQFMIEVLMQIRKDKFKEHPIIPEGLDLVEEEDQIPQNVELNSELKIEDGCSTLPSSQLLPC